MSKMVPWLNWPEWLEVYNLLKSDPLASLQALEIWKIRSLLPVRIESTRLILSVLKGTSGSMHINDDTNETHKLALCMCLIRIVNQLCDLTVTKKDRSLSTKALILDIPDYIIDLRHTATHGEVPDIFLIRKGIFGMFDWLLKSYWDAQFEQYKTQKDAMMNQIKRYENKSDLNTLAKFEFNCSGNQKDLVAKKLASNRKKLSEESWGVLFLKLKAFYNKLAESILQNALLLYKKQKRSIQDIQNILDVLVGLEEEMSIVTTPQLKYLIVKGNSDPQACELIESLIQHDILEEREEIEKLSKLSSLKDDAGENFPECSELKFKRWRELKNWKPKPFGAYSVFPK